MSRGGCEDGKVPLRRPHECGRGVFDDGTSLSSTHQPVLALLVALAHNTRYSSATFFAESTVQTYRLKYRGGIAGVLGMVLCFLMVIPIPIALLILPLMYELVPKE